MVMGEIGVRVRLLPTEMQSAFTLIASSSCGKICSKTGYDSDEIRRHASRVHSNQNAEVEYRPKAELETAVKEMMDTCKIIGFHNPTGESSSSALLKGDDETLENLRKSILGSSQMGMFDPEVGNQSLFSGYLCAALARLSSEKLKCNLCSESISNKPEAVVYHLRGHISFTKFVCPYCGIYIESALCYEMHLNSEHADMDNQRPIDYVRRLLCKELSEMVEVLFDGINHVLTLKCELCGQMVLWRWPSLLVHARQHENYYPYQCGICDTMFPDQIQFTQHLLQANHPIKQTTMQVISNYEAEEQSFRNLSKCFPLFTSQLLDNFATKKVDTAVCVEETSVTKATSVLVPAEGAQSSSNYKSPRLQIPTSGKATLHCKLCQAKISRNMSCLIAHAKVHLAYKPLKCDYCNFRHFAMSKIRRHNTRVHGNKSVKVSYHPVADIGRQIKEMKLECFGSCLSSRSLYQRSTINEEEVAMEDELPSAAENADAAQTTAQLSFLLPFAMDTNKGLPLAGSSQESRGPSTPAGPGISILNLNRVPGAVNLDEMLKQESVSSEHSDLPGLGKKMCCLCSTYIANNPSSFENHACKHLDYKPYHCQYCTYQSYIRGKVTRHIQQVHNGFPVRIVHRPVPGIKDRITDMKLQCFPFLSGLMDSGLVIGSPSDLSSSAGKYGSAEVGYIACKLCDQRIPASETGMNDHVQVHISSKFYHCPVCTYATTFLIRAKQHVHSAHPQSQETRILCCPPDGMQGLQALRNKCFGTGDTLQEAVADCSVAGSSDKTKTDCDETLARSDSNVSAALNNDCDHEETIADTEGTGTDVMELDEGDNNNDCKITCAVCKETVPRQLSTIALHARQHIVIKVYQCAYCGWSSEDSAEVKVHCVSNHSTLPIKVISGSEWAQMNAVQKCFPDFSIVSAYPGSGGSSPSSSGSNQTAGGVPGSTGSGTVLRKLICHVCNCNIADNPKSIGIHVKNHLNYKPYRCPYCHYMSCEQSKARRHVEHVHSVSGDSIEIRAEDNIKEKIVRMKSKCFPNASSLALSESCCNSEESILGDIPPVGKITVCQESPKDFKVYECQICKERISSECVESHVRTHLGKPYKCAYCTSRFWTEDKVKYHIETVHPDSAAKTEMQDEDLDAQFKLVQKKCFPNYEDSENEKDAEDSDHGTAWGDDKLSPEEASSLGTELAGDSPRALSKMASDSEISAYLQKSSSADGRLTCQLCKQSVSMNPNSLDVHVKNHLNFKPHQCPCCDYKSCTSGKVKRHLDSVHRGVDSNVISFTQSSSAIKQIISDMRSMCFPQIEGDFQTKTKAQLASQANELRQKIAAAMELLVSSSNGDGLSDCSDSNAVPADECLTIDEGEDEASDEGEDLDANSEYGTLVGKLNCQLCGVSVADNPSSLGLHVRNHLQYKPFHCNLCEYKSCIQAKVKRHLRNVHKCPMDEMTYNPIPEIRLKVIDMKMQCFPKIDEPVDFRTAATSSPMTSSYAPVGKCKVPAVAAATHDEAGVQSNCDKPCTSDSEDSLQKLTDGMESISSLMNSMLGTSDLDLDESGHKLDLPADNDSAIVNSINPDKHAEIDCQICAERVTNDALSRTKHLTRHLGDYEFKCHYCDFSSFVQTESLKHVTTVHPGSSVRVTRCTLSGKQISSAYERLGQQCFPNDAAILSDKNGSPFSAANFKVTCTLCLSQFSSCDIKALFDHSTEHMEKKHYKCGLCDFLHEEKSKVKEHCRTEHSDDAAHKIVISDPDPDQDRNYWKELCFPDVPNVVVDVQDSSGIGEMEDIDELEEEEAEEENTTTSTNGKRRATNTRMVYVEGPRYICQLCKCPVSMYASSLYVHVKNHMNYKPYCCGHCEYKSPVKSKVRRHIQNAHKGCAPTINYFPTPGIDHEVLRWKKKCFPEVTSFATLANDKVPCLLCKTDVADTLLSKSVHAKNHLDSKPYHCGYCAYKSCLRGETRRHVVRQHIGLPVNIVFKETEVASKDRVTRMIHQCFVTGCGQAGKDTGSGGSRLRRTKSSLIEDVSAINEDIAAMLRSETRGRCRTSSSNPNMCSKGRAPAATVGGPGQESSDDSRTTTNIGGSGGKETAAADVKLGQAYRVWRCRYCNYIAHSKYIVKQHCVTEHPGKPVEVSDANRFYK